jgi:hypothetical protein
MGNGLWSETKPQCVSRRVACPQSKVPSNGFWLNQSSNIYCGGIPGMKYILVCKKGYRPVGQTFTICNGITDKFSQPIPYCVPQYLEIKKTK